MRHAFIVRGGPDWLFLGVSARASPSGPEGGPEVRWDEGAWGWSSAGLSYSGGQVTPNTSWCWGERIAGIAEGDTFVLKLEQRRTGRGYCRLSLRIVSSGNELSVMELPTTETTGNGLPSGDGWRVLVSTYNPCTVTMESVPPGSELEF